MCRKIKIMTWILCLCVYFRNSVINCLLLQYSYCSCCMQKQICLGQFCLKCCNAVWFFIFHAINKFDLGCEVSNSLIVLLHEIQMMQKNTRYESGRFFFFNVNIKMKLSQFWVPKLATIKPTWHYWT